MSGSKQHGERETALVAMLFDAQFSLCFHCGEPMLRGAAQRIDRSRGWSREHVYPKGGDGKGLANNFVLAHPKCNGARGDRTPTAAEIIKAELIYSSIGLVAFESNRRSAQRTINRRAEAIENRRWVSQRGNEIVKIPLATLGDIWPVVD